MSHLSVLRFPSEETKSPPKKAAKPARKKVTDLPVWVHSGKGLWCRKVRGKHHYFGRVADDPKGDAARKLWLEQRDDLLAGRVPRAKVEGLTLRELCNKFLTSKKLKLTLGTLSPRSFVEYNRSTDILIQTFGADRLVIDLRPVDFEELYAKLVKDGYGISTIGREVIHIRSVLKHAFTQDLIERPVKFGDGFKPPSRIDKRKHRAKQKHEHGKRLFTAQEIRNMLDGAGPQLKAMILLGANAGLGNSDVGALPVSALDLENAVLDYPRKKTGVERLATLWPETVAALRKVLEKRRKPKDPAHANLVFLTKHGQPWVRYEAVEETDEEGKVKVSGRGADAVAAATGKLLRHLGIYRRGLSFYTLRHNTETIGGQCGDQVAVDVVMGHVDPSMAAEYREELEADGDLSRLKKVTDRIHAWLFPRPTKVPRAKGRALAHGA